MMQSDLEAPRRLLILSYRRYLEADRDWILALRDARSWFPAEDTPPPGAIGAPGSHLRRIHDRRERALQRLLAARDKLDRARNRFSPDRTARARITVRLITHA